MKKSLLLTIAFFSIAQSLTAQRSYYISTGGNDNNTGSMDNPFKSISKINGITFQPGDQILLEGNSVFAGELVLDHTDSSKKDAPVKIGSYGKGRATILAASGNAILVNNLNGVIIENINVSSPDIAQNYGYGIKVFNDRPGNGMLEYVRIKNIKASNFRWAGIYVGGIPTDLPKVKAIAGSRYGFKDVLIDSCVAHNNMYYGIYSTASWSPDTKDYGNADITVRNCVVYDNTGDSTYTANHSGSGILIDDADKALIEYCVAYHNGHLNAGKTGGPCGIWAHCANNVLIQYCESYNNKTNGAADGTGFDLDGGVTNSTIQYCYSHDNDGAGYLMWNYEEAPHELSNNTIRYCLSINDGRKHSYGAVHIGTSGLPIKNINVYNNTIIITEAPGARPKGLWTGGSVPNENIHFYNNLIVTDGKIDLMEIEPGEKNIVFGGNAYWCMGKKFKGKYNGVLYDDFKEWRKATGQEKISNKLYGVFADPKLVINKSGNTLGDAHKLSNLKSYRLLRQSPLKKNGVNLQLLGIPIPSKDFWGNSIQATARPDIGAFQVSQL